MKDELYPSWELHDRYIVTHAELVRARAEIEALKTQLEEAVKLIDAYQRKLIKLKHRLDCAPTDVHSI